MTQKNDKRTINGWALFDWANSVYALVIATAVFPIYFVSVTPEIIQFGSLSFTNSALYTFAVSFSYLFIALLSPLLSGIADYSGRKKFFLKAFTLMGSLSCIALFWFSTNSTVWWGTIAFMLATIGFAGGIVFYDAYLPQIATQDNYDNVSAKGFAYGYFGSVILLIIILAMIQKPSYFGLDNDNIAIRIGFVMVGLWWLGFSQISFRRLPKDIRLANDNLLSSGYTEIKKVFGALAYQPHLKMFLGAFFFYSAGVQTVIYVATLFAKVVLEFETSELIVIVLVIQLVAIGGAYLFAKISDSKGNKTSLMCMLLIWILVCVFAYITESKSFFYFLAGLVGLVLGGIQSLSRSTYSKMLLSKEQDLTSYFSFYDVLYKLSIVSGTFLFGIVDSITGNMRYSVLVLAAFFIAGMIMLSKVRIENPINHS